MKKLISKIGNHPLKAPTISITVVIVLAIFLTMCFGITEVEQPESAIAGETITIRVHALVEDDPNNEGIGVSGSELVFGFLAPKSWNAREHTTVSVESVPFSHNLVMMEPDAIEPNSGQTWIDALQLRVGIGENYAGMEWIMFRATEAYNPEPEFIPLEGVITVETVVGDENLIGQLGYFVGDNEWGMWDFNENFGFFFTPCMEVTGGEGETKNYCGPAPEPETVFVTPESYAWNDLVNIRFDATKGANGDPTRLIGASQVYICAQASYDGGSVEVCEPSDQTALRFLGDDIWAITIWPTAFFDLPAGSEIDNVTYNFQNQNGNIIVRNPDTGTDFLLTANCP